MADAVAETPGIFSFEGRINRGRFWALVLGVFAAVIVLGILAAIVIPMVAPKGDAASSGGAGSIVALAVMGIVYVTAIWISFATQAKRWHDLDKSGWFVLLNLIPLINLFVLIYLGVQTGTPGPNRFGPPPA